MDRAALVRKILLVLSALGLAVVWGSAAFLKSLDPGAFAEQITQHHVTPAAWSSFLAIFFITIEAMLVAAHLSFWRPRLVFIASGLLLIGFMGVTAIAWANGNTEGCGCFGRLAARHPREVIVEDLGFLLMAVAGYWAAGSHAVFGRSRGVLLALLPLAVALPIVGPHLPFDSLVTTFNPGEEMTNLAAEDLPQGLDEGDVLLVLVGPDCPACDQGLESLNQIAATDGAPTVIAVYAGSRSEAQSWALDHVPGFAVSSAPVKVLRQYYRKLPQVGLLSEGKLVRVWRGTIPTAAEIAG